ncbi:MAG: PEGA domain-containing protein [Methanofollis sp.]|uniref:PEGA domain-containing protein n=1 Tax=Methanofollis sp. TaxID=2052835 RepID=UPI002639D559|nr:PEGA domain-containing protein [Methanofollis sp.]MDD4255451.1 PEGA domain-containing protein [Methanofollis sp.]
MKTEYCGILILLIALVAGVAADESVPALPHEFWGTVTIDGSPAPAGTEITAMIGDTRGGSVTTTVAGIYGSSTTMEGARLVVSGTDGQEGQIVTFLVSGQAAQETATFTPGVVTHRDLHVRTTPETGSIAVTSVPSGVAISLDGVTTGQVTNSTLANIPVGEHTVSVTLSGYRAASKTVTVSSGQTASVHFVLEKETGSISVTSVPAGATISLDGVSTGQVTNGTLANVPVGTHTITVTKVGYLDASSQVTVVRDQTASVHFNLEKPVDPPVANFTAAPTDGAVPLSVQFTDLSTDATAWLWSFGDGAVSTTQHPTHTYTSIGRYTVTLIVTNTAGTDALVRPRFISVRDVPPAPPEDETDYVFDSEGMNITFSGGQQQVLFNATAGNGTVSGDAILLSTGNLNLTLRTDGLSTNGTVSTGNVTGVLLESSRPSTAPLGDVGNVSVAFNASMNVYNPDLRIKTSIYDKPSDGASTAFTLAAADEGLNLTSTAYAVYFTKTNLGANDTISDAYLHLTVSPEWVNAHGGTDAIRIFRQGDDGVTSVLETTYLGLDTDGMMIFEAYSPEGFSAFAVGATKAAATPEPTSPSSSSHSSGGGNSVKPTTSTGTAPLLTASWGGVLRPYIVYVDRMFAHLSLETGVKALDKDGKPLPEVGITAISVLPSASSLTFSGYAVECSPADATFSPAIGLVFTFTADEWAALLSKAGGDPARLVVQGYNPSTGAWKELQTEVSAHTVTAPISHFSTYALLIGPAAEEPVTTAPTTTTTSVITTTTASTPVTGTGGIPLFWIALFIVVAAALIGGYAVMKRH